MPRNVFHRDFTLLRAVLLAGLIGVATLLGNVPRHDHGETASVPRHHSIQPVTLELAPEANDGGVSI